MASAASSSDRDAARQPPRRRLLAALGGGAVLAAAERTLPHSWTRPVVNHVLLPAHAQLSEAGGECDLPLTIGDAALSCGAPPTTTVLTFYIDDGGDCPAVATGQPALAADGIRIIATSDGATFVSMAMEASPPSQPSITQLCDSAPSPPQEFALSLAAAATSGAPWQVRFILSRDATTVYVSDIELTPM